MNARLKMILSMTVFGTIGLFVRNIPLSSGEIALCRAMLAVIAVGIFLIVTKQKFSLADIKGEILLLLLSGIAMGFNWILLFEAYKYTTVSVATLSYYFAPTIVMVACPILFKEKMSVKQWICFGMSTLGILLIMGIGDLSTGSNHMIGISLGLGAACLYAMVILLNKCMKRVEGIKRTFLQFLAAILVLVPYVFCSSGVTIASLNSVGWVYLMVVGLVHTGVAYCLYFSSLKELSGQKVAILSYIDPLVAVLVSVLLLQESMTGTQVMGAVLILGFALWNEL